MFKIKYFWPEKIQQPCFQFQLHMLGKLYNTHTVLTFASSGMLAFFYHLVTDIFNQKKNYNFTFYKLALPIFWIIQLFILKIPHKRQNTKEKWSSSIKYFIQHFVGKLWKENGFSTRIRSILARSVSSCSKADYWVNPGLNF